MSDDLSAKADLDNEQISERMSGNLCRCAAYPGIINAIRQSRGMALDGEAGGNLIEPEEGAER